MARDECKIGIRRKDAMSPCKDCQDKVPGCHGVCKRFEEYQGVLKKIREYRRQHKRWDEDTLDRDWWHSREELSANRRRK